MDQLPRTAIPHLHSPKSTPDFISTLLYLFTFYFFLLLHFSSVLLISFMFHVLDLSAFIHTIQITISEYFWMFVHSCICSITVLQNKKVWLHSSMYISSSVDNCITPHYNLHHCLAHHVHFYHSHHQQSEPSYICIVPKLPSKFTLSFRHTLMLGIVSIIHHLLWKDWRTSVLHF